MAYGDLATVLFYLGLTAVDDDYFTEVNIDVAIVGSDIWVDEQNSDAAAANKTQASSAYAAGRMRNNKAFADLQGMKSIGQTEGIPASVLSEINQLEETALSFLTHTISSRSDADI